MPISASGAWKGTKIVIAPIDFVSENFSDSFLGGTFGAEYDFPCCPTSSEFSVDRCEVAFVIHNAISFKDT